MIDYPVNHVPRTVALSEQVIKPNFSLGFFAARTFPLAALNAQTARRIILRVVVVVVLLLVLVVVG